MSESTNDVQIVRTFNAPITTVWDMWAKAENFQKWYGPEGAKIPTAEFDLQVGGKRLTGMELNTPNGLMTMWFAGEYLEINPVTKLSYTEVMSDDNGNHLAPSAMGMPGDEPTITTVIVELKDLGDSTEMTLTHVGVPAGSPGEMGWNMAITKLEGLLRG